MFSLGVILLELVLGWPVWLSMNCIVKHLANNKNVIKTVGVFSVPMRDKAKICDRQVTCIRQIEKAFVNSMTITKRDPQLEDLIKKMLNLDSTQRISPIDALNHPYLK